MVGNSWDLRDLNGLRVLRGQGWCKVVSSMVVIEDILMTRCTYNRICTGGAFIPMSGFDNCKCNSFFCLYMFVQGTLK